MHYGFRRLTGACGVVRHLTVGPREIRSGVPPLQPRQPLKLVSYRSQDAKESNGVASMTAEVLEQLKRKHPSGRPVARAPTAHRQVEATKEAVVAAISSFTRTSAGGLDRISG